MAKIIERAREGYEVEEVAYGKVYAWRPESVVVECECGKNPILTASETTCRGCGTDHRAIVEEVVLEARPEDNENEIEQHPWRSLRPYYAPTRGT